LFMLGVSVFGLCLGVVSLISLFALFVENVAGLFCSERP
jgi:hypothetical protein